MSTFDIFSNDNGDTKVVKYGFSWLAFFFGPLWAFSNGLVGHGFGLIVYSILISGLLSASASANEVEPIVTLLLMIAIWINFYIGASGNDWKRNRLINKGYHLIRRVEGTTKHMANKDSAKLVADLLEQQIAFCRDLTADQLEMILRDAPQMPDARSLQKLTICKSVVNEKIGSKKYDVPNVDELCSCLNSPRRESYTSPDFSLEYENAVDEPGKLLQLLAANGYRTRSSRSGRWSIREPLGGIKTFRTIEELREYTRSIEPFGKA